MIHLTLTPRIAIRAALCAVAALSLSNCKKAEEETDKPNKPAPGEVKPDEGSKTPVEKIGEGVKELGEQAVEGAKAAGEKIGEGAKAVGEKTVEGAKVVGEKIGEGAKAVGEGAKELGEKTVEGAKAAGEAVKEAVTPDP